MPFIGIISKQNTENCIRDGILENINLRESSVLFIKEKSIDNIKHIKFETVIIAREFKDIESLKEILKNATYLIINSDIESNLTLIQNIKATVITFGFNSKATITASSVEDEEILICLQRSIENKEGKNIEPQEIEMNIYKDASCSMAVAAVLLLYNALKI